MAQHGLYLSARLVVIVSSYCLHGTPRFVRGAKALRADRRRRDGVRDLAASAGSLARAPNETEPAEPQRRARRAMSICPRCQATDVVVSCTSRCLACRSRTPPQCVLCGGAACCPSEDLMEQLVSTPGGDVAPMLADRCGAAVSGHRLPARLLSMAFDQGSVCIMCRYWHAQ